MASLNTNLKELSKKIKLKSSDVKERSKSIEKFIKKELNSTFNSRFIGSYAIKTTVKQKDKEYDIDTALIFEKLNDDQVKDQKQKVFDALKKYEDRIKDNPKVKCKEYAVTIDFESSNSGSKYHFDFTIYNKDFFVVKGKLHTQKELEESGNIAFVDEIKDLGQDSKEHFHIVTRILKHCVKNGSFNKSWNIPSIVLTSITKDFVDSDWDGSDDFLETITTIFKKVKDGIYNGFELPFEPKDNPFERFSNQQNSVTKNKLEETIEILDNANLETDDVKKWELIIDLFPELEKPTKGSGDGEKSSIKRTVSSQGA